MPPEVEGGTWANFAVISSSMHEFSIDFVRMNGSMPTSGVVVQRINVSALLAQQLIDVRLSPNLTDQDFAC